MISKQISLIDETPYDQTDSRDYESDHSHLVLGHTKDREAASGGFLYGLCDGCVFAFVRDETRIGWLGDNWDGRQSSWRIEFPALAAETSSAVSVFCGLVRVFLMRPPQILIHRKSLNLAVVTGKSDTGAGLFVGPSASVLIRTYVRAETRTERNGLRTKKFETLSSASSGQRIPWDDWKGDGVIMDISNYVRSFVFGTRVSLLRWGSKEIITSGYAISAGGCRALVRVGDERWEGVQRQTQRIFGPQLNQIVRQSVYKSWVTVCDTFGG